VPGAVHEGDDLESGLDMLAALLLAELGQQQRQLDVLRRRQHRHQVVELKHEADAGRAPAGEFVLAQPVDALAGHVHLADVRPIDAAEQVEQRRLARAGRPHHRDEVAGRDGEIEVIEDRNRLLTLHEGFP
jgi:hypothetical protein